jgi:hypothetical protein
MVSVSRSQFRRADDRTQLFGYFFHKLAYRINEVSVIPSLSHWADDRTKLLVHENNRYINSYSTSLEQTA